MSNERPLPLFAKVGALKDMSFVARDLVMARKAVAEIRAIEDKIGTFEEEGKGLSDAGFVLAMKETAKYASIAASSATDAAAILKALRPRLDAYLRMMGGAVV